MPRFLVLSVNRSLPFFGLLFLFALFPVRSLAQSPSITDVRTVDNNVDYTGAVGQSVKINGSNFGSTQGTSTVTFNGTAAAVSTWGATAVYVYVPSGATSGNLLVTVGGTASNAKSFTVLARPNIVALRNFINASDYTGAIGAWLKIMGGGFATSQGSSTVTFNGTAVTAVDVWSEGAIYTYVPGGATSGNLVVTVGGVASNSVSFTVLAGPKILTVRNTSNVDITSGAVGTAVRIFGGGFGTSQGTTTVTFNGTAATAFTSWNGSAIYTTVPAGSTTGNLVVTVGGTASNSYSFTVAPIVSSVTPTTGGAGTVVQISGSNFGSSQGSSTVNINGTSVGTASTWQNTNIAFTMPAGLSNGNLIVTANGLSSSTTSFTVTTTPTVYTVTPTTAGAGDIIQITGCNFGSSQGSSTVKINGTSVGTTSTWQQGYISFTMPPGLSSGNLVVHVSGVDTGATSFTVTQPSITSISPTSGAPGLHVTINGSYFSSSVGSVTFNGTSASIYSWNSAQIVATVPTGVTSGSVVATVGGIQTNGSTFTAVTPPTASASAWPAANGGGWNNTNVTVTFTCTAGGLTITSCSTPQNVTSEGSGQIITGGATDSSGDVANASVTLNIDRTPPTLTVSSPSDGDSTSSSSTTVSGTVSDSRSGLSGVSCNGSATTVTSGTFSCNISLSVGVNLIVIRGTDIAGNVAGANLHITRTGSYSTTTSLQIGPSVVNMVVGDTQQFSLADQDGHVRTDATWAVDDTGKATLPDANTPTLTAVSTGDVTLTATIGSTTSSATIHVLSGTSLTDGTVRWSSTSGYYVQQIVQAQPTPNGPDLYSLEAWSTSYFMRALTKDGRQLWVSSLPSGTFSAIYLFPENNGGIFLRTVPISGSEQDLLLDGQTGSQVWSTTLPALYPQTMAIGANGLNYQLRHVTDDTINNEVNGVAYRLVGVDAASGTVVFDYKLPYSTFYSNGDCTGTKYNSGNFASTPTIDSDGSVMVAFSNAIQCAGSVYNYKLWLLRISTDGTITTTEVQDVNWPGSGYVQFPIPDTQIPDGSGGVLASWYELPNGNLPGQNHIAHVTSGGISDFQFDYHGTLDELVLGDPETGLAYAGDGGRFYAFSISSGDIAWSYDATSHNGGAHIIASATGGGLVTKALDWNETTSKYDETILRFDSSGTATSDSWTGTKLDYYIGNLWTGFASSGESAEGYYASTILLSSGLWPMPSQRGSNAAPLIVTEPNFTQTGAHQTAITNFVQEILTKLQNPSLPGADTCRYWIEHGTYVGVDAISYLESTLTSGWGHATLVVAGDLSGAVAKGIGAVSEVPPNHFDSPIPTSVFTIVNDISGFFDSTPNPPNGWGIHNYPGDGPKAQGTILLHELGHTLKLEGIVFDNARPISVFYNNTQVDTQCGQFISILN